MRSRKQLAEAPAPAIRRLPPVSTPAPVCPLCPKIYAFCHKIEPFFCGIGDYSRGSRIQDDSPVKGSGGELLLPIREVSQMISESILGLETHSTEQTEQKPSDSNVDVRLNTLRETVLQLLDEVESLAISRPVDIKRGARFSDEVRQFEVSLIRTALGRTSGSQTRAARLLGLKPTTLNAKIKRYGITA